MSAGSYLISRTIDGAVCEKNPNSFWCKPISEVAITLFFLVLFLVILIFDMVGFYKMPEYSKRNKIAVFFIYFIKLPKRLFRFIRDI